MDDLRLYYLPSCPYCNKVLLFLESKGIELKLCSTLEPENRSFLIENGGKNQVPCLFIDNQALYESDDIIVYLEKRYA